LIARKVAGSERETLTETDVTFREGEYRRLVGELEAAARDELLVRLRLETCAECDSR
jgi:hypothetical protein